ncbi:PilW family protein [Halomonas korlensis]|uniref:Prepilin-type N-terminal cleavage/methylation domain-containing protein n=1 Tax=Halomonas korlensis TaxID=463301 RepID=A0A1I7K1M4_9GAMM|nr:prepilin-type N-terminal cleavage/methylation domain-containing protein [Halomonas korlensis]SFU91378.1 prepilin-type N-terminal cleavage/methylation domain-containing protein [Halomonas korlensis]
MKRNSGFSLIELMVAMVIGLIIILGAGQLFLTVFQTNRQVEMLGEKQAAVNFAVDILLRDIRRANTVTWDSSSSELKLVVTNRGDISTGCATGDDVAKVYKLSDSAVSDREGWALEAGQECTSTLPSEPSGNLPDIVSAFVDNGFSVDNSFGGEGVWVVTFKLLSTSESGSDELVFYAVNRSAAVTN